MKEVEKLKKQLADEQKQKKEYADQVAEFRKEQKQFKLEKFESEITALSSMAQGKIPKDQLNKFCEVL
jgi:hypothetical protein